MTGPLIVVVESEREVLLFVEEELRDRYGRSYEVVGVRSAPEAVATLTAAADNGGPAASSSWTVSDASTATPSGRS